MSLDLKTISIFGIVLLHFSLAAAEPGIVRRVLRVEASAVLQVPKAGSAVSVDKSIEVPKDVQWVELDMGELDSATTDLTAPYSVLASPLETLENQKRDVQLWLNFRPSQVISIPSVFSSDTRTLHLDLSRLSQFGGGPIYLAVISPQRSSALNEHKRMKMWAPTLPWAQQPKWEIMVYMPW
jgi:hypothetical protein